MDSQWLRNVDVAGFQKLVKCCRLVSLSFILLFIVEYKPPYKLSVGDLLWGLREDMSILEVIERDTIPTDLKERLEHNSDESSGSCLDADVPLHDPMWA